jgi:CelD/BcsL family acetyltransferase involved in cellulose biosynthesis
VIAQEVRGDVRLLEDLASPWSGLCLESPHNEPFYRPEFLSAYFAAFEPGAPIVLTSVKAGSRYCAILPLASRTGLFNGLPARILRGPANAHSGRFDLLRAAGEEGDRAVEILWEHLKGRGGWDVLELPLVPAGGAAEQLAQLARRDGYHIGCRESDNTPYVPLAPGMVADQIPSNSHFRQNLRRRMRKAKSAFDVRFSRIDNPDAGQLNRFYALEHSGWKGKNGTSILSSQPTRRFYDELARRASVNGYFSLYLLEFGDTLVGGHFGLTYNGAYYCPKVAYDESFANYGPGHLMILSILEDILPRGYREFDFLGPWMEWKSEWTSVNRLHTFWYIFQKGIYGNALHAVKVKAKPVARAVVRRIRQARQNYQASKETEK